MYNYFGDNMKKIIALLIAIILITGCTNKKEINDSPKEEIKEPIKEEVEIKDEYVDTNPIKVGLYIYSNGKRFLAHEYVSAWPIYTDINGFTAYFSNEEVISNLRLQTVWKSLYNNYTNIDSYKIGYHIKFSTKDGDFSQTILKPSDDKNIYDYIQVYLYDDIHQDSSFYSHMTDDMIKDNTIFTTIKLTTSTKINDITSDIELTAFTYLDDNDFLDGNYRGNSKFTTIIKKK